MHHFRKPKAPADFPAPTSTPPSELVKKRDSRALATLSAGIALSIGSAADDICGTSSDSTTVQGMDAIRQTTYAIARMVIETTKESSDSCPPLKAVVGAMSVLMRNYDVSMFHSQTGHILIFLVSRSSKHQIIRRT
jgi:hypothetical protein